MRRWQTSSTESEGSAPRPATILSTATHPMLISEALLHLQHVGVERIDRIPSTSCPQVWKVTQNGEEYIYAADLERVVWALQVSSDWEG